MPQTSHQIRPTNEIEMMRKLIGKAFWDIAYHEERLAVTYAELNFMREMTARLNFKASDDEILKRYSECAADKAPNDVHEFICSIIAPTIDAPKYHEDELQKVHAELACLKIMMLRGNYTEFTIDEIATEIKQLTDSWE
jgi:hypothetical protein